MDFKTDIACLRTMLGTRATADREDGAEAGSRCPADGNPVEPDGTLPLP